MKRYEAVFNEESLGVYAISLVDQPATGEMFVAFNEDEKEIKLAQVNEEERLLLGLVLAPNQPILRSTSNGELFTVEFNEETIKKLAYSFQKNNNQSNSTIQHEGKNIEGVTFVEQWTVENPKLDKSVNFGLEYPKGSWLAMMKVDNDAIWNDYVKTGKVKGFSIDAMVKFKEIEESNINQNQIQMSKMEKFGDAMKEAWRLAFSEVEPKEEAIEVKADEVVAEVVEEAVEKPVEEVEVKSETETVVEEVVEEPVMLSKDELVEFSNMVSTEVKKQIDELKVEFSKETESLTKDLKDAKEEIVKLQALPVGKPIKSQPSQLEFSKMTEWEKRQALK